MNNVKQIVLVEGRTLGCPGIGHIVRPCVGAFVIRRRESGVGNEHHVPAILGAKMASVGSLAGGALHDDDHSGSSTRSTRDNSVSRNTG